MELIYWFAFFIYIKRLEVSWKEPFGSDTFSAEEQGVEALNKT